MTAGDAWPRDPVDPRDPDLCAFTVCLLCLPALIVALVIAAPFVLVHWAWRIARAARAEAQS